MAKSWARWRMHSAGTKNLYRAVLFFHYQSLLHSYLSPMTNVFSLYSDRLVLCILYSAKGTYCIHWPRYIEFDMLGPDKLKLWL